jgi:hypothetical protein
MRGTDVADARGDIRVQSDEIEVHLEQLSAPRYTFALQSLQARMQTWQKN